MQTKNHVFKIMSRRNIYSYSPEERELLASLIAQYATDEVVLEHHSINHGSTEGFLEGHHQYILQLEEWLKENDGGMFVPLPFWNPGTPVPEEFHFVRQPDNPKLERRIEIRNYHPNLPIPSEFLVDGVGNIRTDLISNYPIPYLLYTSAEAGRPITSLDLWHNSSAGQGVHMTLGGVMVSMDAPAFPAFWLFHAGIDEIYQSVAVPYEKRLQYEVLELSKVNPASAPRYEYALRLRDQIIDFSQITNPSVQQDIATLAYDILGFSITVPDDIIFSHDTKSAAWEFNIAITRSNSLSGEQFAELFNLMDEYKQFYADYQSALGNAHDFRKCKIMLNDDRINLLPMTLDDKIATILGKHLGRTAEIEYLDQSGMLGVNGFLTSKIMQSDISSIQYAKVITALEEVKVMAMDNGMLSVESSKQNSLLEECDIQNVTCSINKKRSKIEKDQQHHH